MLYYFYLIVYCFKFYNNHLELSNHHSLPSNKSVAFNLSWYNTSFVQFLFHFTFTCYQLSSSKSFPFFVNYNCINIILLNIILKGTEDLLIYSFFFPLCSSLNSFRFTGQLVIEKCLSWPFTFLPYTSLSVVTEHEIYLVVEALRIFSGNVQTWSCAWFLKLSGVCGSFSKPLFLHVSLSLTLPSQVF